MVSSIPWQLVFGDPTLLGWFTTVAYFVAAALCAICAWQAAHLFNSERVWQQRLLWGGLALGLLFLGLNKQQDLLGIVTALGRRFAWNGAWYGMRGSVQYFVIAVFVFLINLSSLIAVLVLRPLPRLAWVALAGFIFLSGFAAIRAVSLHAIDRFLYTPVAGVSLNWVFELGGIALIATAALLTLWRAGRQPRPASPTILQ